MYRLEVIPWDIYMFVWIVTVIIKIIIFIIPILVSIALFTLLERKLMAAFQKRKGPNVNGIFGLLQPFADGLKLLLKEDFVPVNSNSIIFRIAPIYTFALSIASWAVIPFTPHFYFSAPGIGLLYIFALSSLSVYGIILSGWASNSKYAFLGSLRSAAQLISYEVSIGFILICIILMHSTVDLRKIVFDQYFVWNIIPLFPIFLLFFISIIAETNRAPFDLPEAEAELVSGYNVEYGGISFALFFLAEYNSIILMSTLTVLLFFGGWWNVLSGILINFNSFLINIIYCFILSIKVQILLTLFVWIRVAFPRYRYDQLMSLGWKVFLPLSMSLVLLTSFSLNAYDSYASNDIYFLLETGNYSNKFLQKFQTDGEYCIFDANSINVLKKEKKYVAVFTGENKDLYEYHDYYNINPQYYKKYIIHYYYSSIIDIVYLKKIYIKNFIILKQQTINNFI